MTAGYIEARVTVPSATTLTATNGGGGPTSVAITAGNYYITDLITHVQARLNADRPGSGGATWTVSLSTADGGTGKVTISMSAGTFSITWTTAALGTLLGHSAITTQTSVTGSNACQGIFIPNCPLNVEGDPRIAPRHTDLRETSSPTGLVFGVVGNMLYRHRRLRYSHVVRERTFDTSAADPSWERFIINAHLGQGHSWFTPCSRIRIVDQTGALVGNTTGITTWQMLGVRGVEPVKVSDAWTGLWAIEIPELVSDGS